MAMSVDDRLDSWKAISAYLKRDVTTVQRWEKREGMPVHRHLHDKLGSVYAYRTELDAWMSRRKPALPEPATTEPKARGRALWVAAVAAVAVLAAAAALWWTASPNRSTPLEAFERAQFQMITDFEGAEQAAAVSRDGRFVAFTSDRDVAPASSTT